MGSRSPLLVLFFGLGLIFSCFPPSAYGLSNAPPDRTLIIPTYGMVLMLIILGTSLGKLLGQWASLAHTALPASALLILIAAVISIHQMISAQQVYINYAAAWSRFNTQMLEFQRNGTTKAVIATDDMNLNDWAGLDVLGDNPKFWLNQCVSAYYHVDVISNSPRP